MAIVQRINASLSEQPLVWVLLAAFLLAEYGNWTRGRELRRVCELLPHEDVYHSRPKTTAQEIASICASRLDDDSTDASY